MNQVHFIDNNSITPKEQQLLRAAKTSKTKTDNTIGEIKKAIEELQAENINPSQTNVIRRLNGKRSRRTVINYWKNLMAKPQIGITDVVSADLPKQPLHRWTNEELGIPTLEQERKFNACKSDAVLMWYLMAMREMRIKELQRSIRVY